MVDNQDHDMYRGKPTEFSRLWQHLQGFWSFSLRTFSSDLVMITFSLAQSRTTRTKMTDDDGLCKQTNKQKLKPLHGFTRRGLRSRLRLVQSRRRRRIFFVN